MPDLQQSSAKEIVKRYGSRENILRTFHISNQTLHASDPLRCILGKAPTLKVMNEAYGNGTTEEWLMYQLVDLIEFVGVNNKLTPYQLKSLCDLIVQKYGWLKVTDIELFFHRIKTGEYQRFYGSVDPQMIMQLMIRFQRERNLILAEYYEEMDRQARERSMQGAVTWEEYQATHPDARHPLEGLSLESFGKKHR